jgi:membrane associated rhomboid family serine protease
MMGFERTDDYQPLTYIRGRPLYVTTLLVVLHSLALIAGSLLEGFRAEPDFLLWFAFSSNAVWNHWMLWQPFTYVFVHGPSVWFLVDMFFFYIWGLEVEKYFGRRVFIALYSSFVLTAPLVLMVYGKFAGVEERLADSQLVHFAVFLSFVVIYPNVQFFFGILAKWIAWALLAIQTLLYLSGRQYGALLVLWSTVLVAYYGTRYAGAGGGLDFLSQLRERFPRRVVPSGIKPRAHPRRPAAETYGNAATGSAGDVHESIDPLLDKISKHGLASLTHSERATLERARASLLRKERGG